MIFFSNTTKLLLPLMIFFSCKFTDKKSDVICIHNQSNPKCINNDQIEDENKEEENEEKDPQPLNDKTISLGEDSARTFSDHTYAKNCEDYRRSKYYTGDIGDGLYWIQPVDFLPAFIVYCDMTTYNGGWTLVWSNLIGGTSKPFTNLTYQDAIESPPLFGAQPISENIENFLVYTGLQFYNLIQQEALFRYQWSNELGSDTDQEIICTFSLNENGRYRLSLTDCDQKVGSTIPGIVSHGSYQFQADPTQDCYSLIRAPYWHGNCGDGAITGGGESQALGVLNGAYWSGSDSSLGSDNGLGAGNGWFFIK